MCLLNFRRNEESKEGMYDFMLILMLANSGRFRGGRAGSAPPLGRRTDAVIHGHVIADATV